MTHRAHARLLPLARVAIASTTGTGVHTDSSCVRARACDHNRAQTLPACARVCETTTTRDGWNLESSRSFSKPEEGLLPWKQPVAAAVNAAYAVDAAYAGRAPAFPFCDFVMPYVAYATLRRAHNRQLCLGFDRNKNRLLLVTFLCSVIGTIWIAWTQKHLKTFQ